MSDLFLYDDAAARGFEPFALTRPASELRAGALLLRERWERALGLRAAGVITATHLSEFEEPWAVQPVAGRIPKGAVVANSRCAVSIASTRTADTWTCDGRIAAVTLQRDVDVAELRDGGVALDGLVKQGGKTVDIGGWWIEHVWDFIGALSPMLLEDIPALSIAARPVQKKEATVLGNGEVFVEEGGTVEPHVVFDTHAGPVLVRRGATVQAFTRIVGPLVVGRDSAVGGDKIANCSIGEVCKVHGEVSSTIFLGHANKNHDGFVGHSYLGRWVNLGAGTITSNLKNTYGTVQFWTPVGEQDSGLQFLGSYFGDHAKTGIGTSLTTGCVIGAGANIYGGVMPPKVIPPFAWGDRPPYSTYRMDKFLAVAERVMKRRHVELSEQQRRTLERAARRARDMGLAP